MHIHFYLVHIQQMSWSLSLTAIFKIHIIQLFDMTKPFPEYFFNILWIKMVDIEHANHSLEV